MAIADQIQELKAGLSAIKDGLASAIQNKGVTVTSDMKLKDFPSLVQSIELGIDADLTGLEATNIKAGVTINGITGNFTADADALSTDLRLNKIAYVNGNKITGRMADVSVYKDGDLTVGIHEGYSVGSSITLSDDNLIANNIRKNVTIFGVTGSMEEPDLSNLTEANIKTGITIDGITGNFTSDATASADDIRYGKVAYVKGNQVTGNVPNVSVFQDGYLTVAISTGYSEGSSLTLTDSNLTASNIRKGTTIFGVTGSLEEGINTSDANAVSADIRAGKTAYVNGSKVTGSIPDVQLYQNTGDYLTVSINSGYTAGGSYTIHEPSLLPENIKKDVILFGVRGTLETTVSGGGDASYYKCIYVNNDGTWVGVKAELVNGTYVFTGSEETLQYVAKPINNSVYDSTAKIVITEMNVDKCTAIYRRPANTGMDSGYNLNLLDEITNDYYSNDGYYLTQAKGFYFKDYTVPYNASYALVIGSDGNLYSWGSYSWGDCITGQGGAVTNPNPNRTSYRPRLADASGNWKKIFATYERTWVLNNNNELYRCGCSSNGELGFPNTGYYWKLTKLELNGITSWKKVVMPTNGYRSYILSTDGRLFVAGYGYEGQLGLGSSTSYAYSFTEITVSGVSAWKDVFCGEYNAGAISSDGKLYVWGSNSYGQCASTNTSNYIYTPTRIGSNKVWKSASFGNYHLMAVTEGGELWGCGRTNYGQLGVGSSNTDNRYELVRVGSKNNWVSVNCFQEISMILDDESKVFYCGYYSSQYGGGSSASSYSPTYHGYKIGDYQRLECDRIVTNEWDGQDMIDLKYFKGNSTLTVPDECTSLAYAPFSSYERSYNTIYIPKSVKTIASNAFSNMWSTNIIFECEENEKPAGFPYGHSQGSSYFTFGAKFEHVSSQKLAYLLSDTFPNNYRLDITEGVTSLSYYMISNYNNLTSALVPSSATYGSSAFYNCPNLKELYIDDITDNSDMGYLIYNCNSLTTIYCNWEKGDKPNMENYAPWGAPSSATVIYKKWEDNNSGDGQTYTVESSIPNVTGTYVEIANPWAK